jgi:hypothetical protein
MISILLSVHMFEKMFKSLPPSLISFNHRKTQIINCSLKLKNVNSSTKQKDCSYPISPDLVHFKNCKKK